MKNIAVSLLFLFLTLAVSSCKKEEPAVYPESTSLIGTWVNPQYSENQIIFDRSGELPENNYGLNLMSEGKLIERKNIGWCGTPPISYGDYEGSWTEKDSVVNIEVGFWGGTVILQWKILSVNDDYLTVHQMAAEYIEE